MSEKERCVKLQPMYPHLSFSDALATMASCQVARFFSDNCPHFPLSCFNVRVHSDGTRVLILVLLGNLPLSLRGSINCEVHINVLSNTNQANSN